MEFEQTDYTLEVLHEQILDQNMVFFRKKEECLHQSLSSSELANETFLSNSGRLCPWVWDDILCWPPTPVSTFAILPCPDYVIGFNTSGIASRYCTENGTWYFNPVYNRTWSNYNSCMTTEYVTTIVHFGSMQNATLTEIWLPIIKKISQIGYSVSLATLIVAFLILALFKKLRCPRNTLHMHLFFSFIMRAFMALLKDNVLIDGLEFSSSIYTFSHNASNPDDQSPWECKLVTSFWQYFIMANYSWIFMEGLYLHNLIFMALFTDSSAITLYILLGWGLPTAFVIPWVAMRIFFDNKLCWTINDNAYVFWLIRGPITVSIVVNFVFFVHVTWVLLLKLRSAVSAETRKYRYRKWAKSTLVLVPLFGVHYTVFGGMSGAIGVNETIEVVWLFCDQLFACFQGFFVAVLYCLLNGEVRGEVNKRWKHWRQKYAVDTPCSTHSMTNVSRSNTSRWRTSFQSIPTSSVIERRDTMRSSLTPSPGTSKHQLLTLTHPETKKLTPPATLLNEKNSPGGVSRRSILREGKLDVIPDESLYQKVPTEEETAVLGSPNSLGRTLKEIANIQCVNATTPIMGTETEVEMVAYSAEPDSHNSSAKLTILDTDSAL